MTASSSAASRDHAAPPDHAASPDHAAPHRFDLIGRADLETPSSRKWSLFPGTVGAWVAEMDFGTAPEITAALHDAVDRGHLGYLSPATSMTMAEACSRWQLSQYGWRVPAANIHAVSDVMAAFEVAVTKFSPAGSGVIIPTPAYMPFLSFTPTLGREVIEVPGVTEASPGSDASTAAAGHWRHDLAGIDEAFRRGARTLVLCNPQNPTGTALSRDELLAIAAIVDRHNGRVFADEIHAPLRYNGVPHIPYASLSTVTARHTITATSASKAWNLPGLKAAQLITSNDADEELYQLFGFAVLHGASTPGVIASAVAYDEGAEWLADVVDYLEGSRLALASLLDVHLPGVRYRVPEATYIAWLDCAGLDLPLRPGESLADFFREEAGVTLTDGRLCGHGYEQYVRLIFATPGPILEQAVRQMGEAVRRRRASGTAAAPTPKGSLR
ncbi:aminotransferase class I/II [Subtercola boreus]|uniref:cysteine-S-conjugate beta-lyase n=1 Tax=Subtercola boreus TaxID=120213 RepID=A0A3E0VH42_9MICO|nr:aminotransferase class I/II-fold pyridoxal phosphate-dependent enzyme [Subtercola boreus]RFA09254.1 aminotransferase class I/II [Subtercola boreus]TQL53718.1 cystathionine beta-lyase [Subtercola boreus]